MAIVEISKINLKRQAGISMPELTAIDSTDGAKVEFDGADEKTLLFIKNTHASESATATILAGNALFSDGGELSVEIAAGVTKLIVLESGKFKMTGGEHKGYLLIAGAQNLSAACVVLP